MNSLAFSLILLSLPLIYGQNDKQILEYVVKQYTKLVKTVETGIEHPTYGYQQSLKMVLSSNRVCIRECSGINTTIRVKIIEKNQPSKQPIA
jgi:hypothetical protein